MTYQPTAYDMLPYVYGEMIALALSGQGLASLSGEMANANDLGIVLINVRSASGKLLGNDVFVPWSSIAYIARQPQKGGAA